MLHGGDKQLHNSFEVINKVMDNTQEQQITGARHSLTLGDLELHLSPLNDQDIAELTMYCTKKYMKVLYLSIENASKAIREETIEVGLRVVSTLNAFSSLGIKLMASTEGMARVVWQQCYRNNNGITIAEILAKLSSDPENMRLANEAFRLSNAHPALPGSVKKK